MLNMWYYLCYCIFVALVTSGEVITIKTNQTITCVLSVDSVYSALDIVPIHLYEQVIRPKKEMNNWTYSDWKHDNDSVSFDVVTDQRWEEFPITAGIKLNSRKQYVSICSHGALDFTAEAFDYSTNQKVSWYDTLKNNLSYCQWSRLAISTDGRNITLQSTTKQMPFDPEWLFINNPTSFSNKIKLSRYNYLSSNNTSPKESCVILNNSGCVFMFVSVDKNCFLDIKLKIGHKIVNSKTVEGFNGDDIKTWRKIEITSIFPERGKVCFLRRAGNGNRGYWAVDDIQLCKPRVEIYKKQTSQGLNHQMCRVLDNSQEFGSNSLTYCSTADSIGEHCNITCQEVLGKDYSHCENHKICLQNGNCHCAWGYQGEFCNKACEGGRWGLNCASTCNFNCEKCSHILGCEKCKKKFFGRNCFEIPVVRTGPVITAITNDSVEIIQNMEYGENETEPEFYIIQYKKMNELQFHNYLLAPYKFTSGNRSITVKIGKLALLEFSYKIRTLLLVQNHSFEENVPEVEVHITNLIATYISTNQTIRTNWNRLVVSVRYYTMQWECRKHTGPNLNNSGILFTEATVAWIRDVKPETKCKINLLAKLKKNNQLIAQTELHLPVAYIDCANVILLNNKIVVELLENCKNVRDTLKYRVTFRCISAWCSNETSKSEDFIFYGNYTTSEKAMELRPFTNFTVNFTESQNDRYEEIILRTPPDKPLAVQNLSVYCKNDDVLWIRWKEPYPPTGILQYYNISYDDLYKIHSFKYDSAPCELWDQFICANITGLKNHTTYRINVHAKNYNVSKWGIPNEVTVSTTQNDLSNCVKVTLLKNEIVAKLKKCEDSGPFSYRVTYRCISKWCSSENSRSEDIKFYNDDTVVKKEVMGLTPFTNFSVNLESRVCQNKLYKEATIRTPPDKPLPVRNLSAYCKNDSMLWIRWKEPYPPRGIVQYYNISYDYLYEIRSFSYSSVPCELWDKFLCANITGLKNNTTYRITVQAKHYNVSDWSEPSILIANTRQNASEVPEDLRIEYCTENNITLSWTNPLNMNGLLEKFCIQINNGDIINMIIEKYQSIYRHTIAVESGRQYNISVWGKNQFEGGKAVINVTILKSVANFSQNLLVEWCTKSCYLLLPRPNFTFEVIVIEKDKQKILRTIYKSTEEKTPQNVLLLKIGETHDQAVSWKNQTHQPCLVFNGTLFGIEYEPAEVKIETDDDYIWAIATGVFLIFLFLLMGFLYYECIQHRKKNIRELTIEMGSLLALESKPIDVKDFENYISTLLGDNRNKRKIPLHHQARPNVSFESYIRRRNTNADTIEAPFGDNSDNKLMEEFRSIPASTRSSMYASKDRNKTKNKEPQNVPYDNCRVVLTEMDGVGTQDYINASYINGYDRPRKYIATQGPKFFTIGDFWRMIWQEKVETIVMAVHFIEGKKRKCAEYFPQKLNTIFECGKMSIKLINEEVYEHYYHRIFELCYRKYNRKVEHLHLKWSPNDLSPLYPNCIVPLVKRISHIREKSNTPIVIHCSGGVNRTGTLILCDLALQMAKNENTLDFCGLLKNMRNERPNMISSERQYLLSHLIVMECIMEEKIFKKTLNLDSTVLKTQLKYLDRLGRHDNIIQSWTPRQEYQLYISNFHGVFVDSYAKTRKYLVIPELNKRFLHHFWDTIVKEEVGIILFLNKMEPIWPYERINFPTFVRVEELSSDSTDWFTSTELLLRTEQLPRHNVILERTVYLFETNSSTRNSNLKNINGLLNVGIHFYKNCDIQAPILVGCCDGITTSGLFVALSYIIEKYQRELEIDVCNAVRTIRRSGVKFVKNKEQLEFLHKAVAEYVQNFDSYTSIL